MNDFKSLSNSGDIKTERKVFNPTTMAFEVVRSKPKFIKGPIPTEWIKQANRLPGKAGSVGVALWFLVGLNQSRTIKITQEIEDIAVCDRKTLYRALTALEEASLVSVKRLQGARAIVTVLDVMGGGLPD